MRNLDPHAKKRIVSIAEQLVAGQIKAGEVDPKDDKAFKAAVKRAVADARQAYFAAEEFLSG